MIKINNLRVYWRHVNNNSVDRNNYLQSKKNKTALPESTSFTECILVNENTGVMVSEKSYCFPLDNFNKNIGRKRSLEKVLKNVPSHKVRKAIWVALKEASPKTLRSK